MCYILDVIVSVKCSQLLCSHELSWNDSHWKLINLDFVLIRSESILTLHPGPRFIDFWASHVASPLISRKQKKPPRNSPLKIPTQRPRRWGSPWPLGVDHSEFPKTLPPETSGGSLPLIANPKTFRSHLARDLQGVCWNFFGQNLPKTTPGLGPMDLLTWIQGWFLLL